MYKKFLYLHLSFLFAILPIALRAENLATAAKIDRYKLTQEKDLTFRYGSSLAYRKSSSYGGGIQTFYMLPGEEFTITNGADVRKSEDVPHIAIVKLKKGKLTIKERFPIFFKKDQKLTVEFEAVATAPNESYSKFLWAADEKNNYLLKISLKTGVVEEVIKPGEGLPSSVSFATQNRGLESVAVAPDGKVYTALQSVINYEGEDTLRSQLIRLYEYDPMSGKSKTFALPIDPVEYLNAQAVKIGDMQMLDANRLLLIEHGEGADGSYLSRIFIVDIKDATDIEKIKTKQPLESYAENIYGKDNRVASPLKKTMLLDLSALGWDYKKPEGIALIDPSTIAIINDWDNNLIENELWVFTLPKPLIAWGWLEKAILLILILIFLLSTILTVLFVFKPKNQSNNKMAASE